MMPTYNVHNVRFYLQEPKTIQTIVYNDDLKLLALSRANNVIEIWNCNYRPFKQHSFIGTKNGTVEALAWCGRWLFAAGQDVFINEFDIHVFMKQTAITGGCTWCLATSPNKSMLACGTEQGFISLFSITEDGLKHIKNLNRLGGPLLSIGWHPNNECLAAGSLNFLYINHIQRGVIMETRLQGSNKKSSISIWSIALLSDMTVVTGDSSGKTIFWNGSLGTQIERLQTHQADILALCVSADEKTVIVAGIDPVIVNVQLVDRSANKRPMWVKSVHRRLHTHDVRALALTQEGKIYSGGVDTYLILSSYPPKVAIKFPGTSYKEMISLSKSCSRLLLGYEHQLVLWQLGVPDMDSNARGEFFHLKEERVKLLTIDTSKKESVQRCQLSPDGTGIAYASVSKLKLFRYHSISETTKSRLEKISCSLEHLLPVKQLIWVNENELLILTCTNGVKKVTIAEGEVTVTDNLDFLDGNHGVQIAVSKCGDYLVVVRSSNLIEVYESDKNSFQLPKLSAPVTALAINDNNELFIALSNMSLHEYNLKTKNYTSFGRLLATDNNADLLKSNCAILNISFLGLERIVLHTHSQFIFIDKTKDNSTQTPPKIVKYARMNLEDSNGIGRVDCSGSFTFINRKNHVSFFSSLNDKELLSVEISPIWLMDSLPPVLKIKKFGALL